MPRINRAIEALEADRAIYYTGAHSGHVLTHAQGVADAATWADYINVGMEHGAFDMTGLAAYMQGLVVGATPSAHRTPAVIVEVPVGGLDEASVRQNAWQMRQILACGVHGLLLCQAEDPEAVRAFVEACRYPHHLAGVDPALPSPEARLAGARVPRPGPGCLGLGQRGRGSENTAAPIWGVPPEQYMALADPWPLNPQGELLLGVKIESPEGVANCEAILAVPGLGFGELGPGDLSLALGHTVMPRPYTAPMRAARARVFAACRVNRLAFLEIATPATIEAAIAEGVRVIAGGDPATAAAGRAFQRVSST
jgi:4-hydroxy-2-oxoheptanedioate aldolase